MTSTTLYRKICTKSPSKENLITNILIHSWDSTVEIPALRSCASCEMKYQMIMARSLPDEVTQRYSRGRSLHRAISHSTVCRATSDNKIRAYVAQGEVLPVATRSFGSIGVFAIPEMGRFYRHVLIEKNYPASRSGCIRTLRKSTV